MMAILTEGSGEGNPHQKYIYKGLVIRCTIATSAKSSLWMWLSQGNLQTWGLNLGCTAILPCTYTYSYLLDLTVMKPSKLQGQNHWSETLPNGHWQADLFFSLRKMCLTSDKTWRIIVIELHIAIFCFCWPAFLQQCFWGNFDAYNLRGFFQASTAEPCILGQARGVCRGMAKMEQWKKTNDLHDLVTKLGKKRAG